MGLGSAGPLDCEIHPHSHSPPGVHGAFLSWRPQDGTRRTLATNRPVTSVRPRATERPKPRSGLGGGPHREPKLSYSRTIGLAYSHSHHAPRGTCVRLSLHDPSAQSERNQEVQKDSPFTVQRHDVILPPGGGQWKGNQDRFSWPPPDRHVYNPPHGKPQERPQGSARGGPRPGRPLRGADLDVLGGDPVLGLRYRPIAPRDNSATHRLAKTALKTCHLTSRQRIRRGIVAAGEGARRRRRRGPEELVAEIGDGIREFDLAVVVKIKHVETGLHFAAD